MDQAAELVLAEGIIVEDADGGQRSSVKLVCIVSSFFTHKTENTPGTQESSSSLHSDYVNHLLICKFSVSFVVTNFVSDAAVFVFVWVNL